ncbi:MAG: hypothetical protein ACHQIM_13420 [Sphingobacteriales bacterium]
MKQSAYSTLCLNLLFILFFGSGYSQATSKQPANATPTNTPPLNNIPINTPTNPNGISRPTDALGVPEVDNYITKCYDLYDQTNTLSAQLNAIEQEVIIDKIKNMDTNGIQIQMATFNGQLITLKNQGDVLLAASSEMTSTAAQSLKNKPFKIPSAIIRVKNSTKAVKEALKNKHTMLTVTMANIDHRLHPLTAADSVKLAGIDSAARAKALAHVGTMMKTSISIKGLGFSGFNSFFTEINSIASIKSTNKRFTASGTSVIDVVHYGTTDDLLNAMLSNCKDVLSEKNIGSSEKGKISLAF